MNKILLLFLVIFSYNFLYGDETPCWCEVSILSSNNLYKAEIYSLASDSSLAPWDRKWKINVYELAGDTTLKWSSDFYHDGYGDGILSNDGKVYAYVNYWLDKSTSPNQITIYTSDQILRYSSKDLKLRQWIFPKTVSHQIWLENYEFDSSFNTSKLIVNTIHNNEISIELLSGKVSHRINLFAFMTRNKYGLGGLLICIGCILIFFKKRKPKYVAVLGL